MLALAQFPTLLWITGSWTAALGYTAASQAEAVICGLAGIYVLGGRKRSPTHYGHIFGMFAGAILGSVVAALLALPFDRVDSLHEFLWRVFGSVLGVLAGTPALLRLRQWLGFGDQTIRVWAFEPKPRFGLVIASLVLLGAGVLSLPYAGLMPLLFVAIVFAVNRYGQMAAACGILAYAAAATLVSLGGRSPVAAWQVGPFEAGLALQGQMLLMLATTLPIAAMLFTRERLETRLRTQNEELSRSVTTLSLAEQLAGLGRWHYDIRTDRQNWSGQMLELNGLPRSLAPDPGNIRDRLPDGGAQMFDEFARQRDNPEPYSFDYRVKGPDGAERVLRMVASNEFDAESSRTALFAVAMDITDQVEREQALASERARAIEIAAEAQHLANTDALTGLANRRCTLDWLERLLDTCQEIDEPIAVLMFDVDHFKQVNDRYGHQTGDNVLVRIAELARHQVRTGDVVGRLGGEEFACLLPGATPGGVYLMAERLRTAIEEGSHRGGLPPVTVSIGVAYRGEEDTGETLLARADAALYLAKDGGRNRVQLAA